jgi:hypothetical protein
MFVVGKRTGVDRAEHGLQHEGVGVTRHPSHRSRLPGAGAISSDTKTELFRRGEMLPEGRSQEEEELNGGVTSADGRPVSRGRMLYFPN